MLLMPTRSAIRQASCRRSVTSASPVIERTANAAPQSLSSKSNCKTDARRFELAFREFYAAPGRLQVLKICICEITTPALARWFARLNARLPSRQDALQNAFRTRRRKKRYDSNVQDFTCPSEWQDGDANHLAALP